MLEFLPHTKIKDIKIIRNFITMFLHLDPELRGSAQKCLQHEFLGHGSYRSPEELIWDTKVEPGSINSFISNYRDKLSQASQFEPDFSELSRRSSDASMTNIREKTQKIENSVAGQEPEKQMCDKTSTLKLSLKADSAANVGVDNGYGADIIQDGNTDLNTAKEDPQYSSAELKGSPGTEELVVKDDLHSEEEVDQIPKSTDNFEFSDDTLFRIVNRIIEIALPGDDEFRTSLDEVIGDLNTVIKDSWAEKDCDESIIKDELHGGNKIPEYSSDRVSILVLDNPLATYHLYGDVYSPVDDVDSLSVKESKEQIDDDSKCEIDIQNEDCDESIIKDEHHDGNKMLELSSDRLSILAPENPLVTYHLDGAVYCPVDDVDSLSVKESKKQLDNDSKCKVDIQSEDHEKMSNEDDIHGGKENPEASPDCVRIPTVDEKLATYDLNGETSHVDDGNSLNIKELEDPTCDADDIPIPRTKKKRKGLRRLLGWFRERSRLFCCCGKAVQE